MQVLYALPFGQERSSLHETSFTMGANPAPTSLDVGGEGHLVSTAQQLNELVQRVGRQLERVPHAQQQPLHAPQRVLLSACAGL